MPLRQIVDRINLLKTFTIKMSDSVVIRGSSYKINPFSDIHLSTINKLLNDIGNIAFQSDSGFVLKEIILPGLPAELIKRTQAGDYIIFLSSTELNAVLTDVMRFYYQTELEKATAANDQEYLKKLKASIAEMEEGQTVLEETTENTAPVSEPAAVSTPAIASATS